MAGEYRLVRKLGQGGFGVVYEAEHPVLKRRAAVKVLHRSADDDSEAVQRFIAEAQAVNQIKSRYIVDVFSFGRLPNGQHFYVMDLLEGEPLDIHLKRVGRVDPVTALQLLRPVAEALDVAHTAGIVHRDLKPQNVFLASEASGETVPKLLDFGMAKLLGDSPVHTVSGTPVGTPLYMSPEQARGERVDARSDVYSLGVLCHEMLTGNVPIRADTTLAVLMAHIVQPPPTVSDSAPDLSPEFDAPVLAMLAKSAEERPASAGAAVSALAAAAERAGLSVTPGLPRLPRPPARPSESVSGLETTLSADSGNDRDAMVRSAVKPKPASALGWQLALALLVAGGIAAYFVVTAQREQPGATPAAVSLTPEPSLASRSATPAPEVSAAPLPSSTSAVPAASVSASASSSAPAKNRRAPAAPAIPRDLESPF